MILCNERYTVNLSKVFTPEFDYLLYRLHDGRITGHLIENIIPQIFPNNELVYRPIKYRDWLYKNQVSIECKCLTNKGIANISPSAMVGSGRKFNEELFNEVCSTRTYCIVDIRSNDFIFPFVFIQGYRGMDHIITSNDFNRFVNQNSRSIDEIYHLQ